MDHVSLLPKQVAVNIFRFVDLQDLVNCSRVCRTWKEITQATVLWSRVFILLVLFILECVFPFLSAIGVIFRFLSFCQKNL